MAWQNRMALDMLLAEKGGVRKMFGSMCCTFIPNNTAPDGSVTRALAGLSSLNEELTENSGIDNSFSFLDLWFGKYKQLFYLHSPQSSSSWPAFSSYVDVVVSPVSEPS